MAPKIEKREKIRYHRNELELSRLIDASTDGLADSVKVAINTMRKHKEYMLNSVRYDISNGSLEGINNKVKVLKRISYGYRRFYNFRLRILVFFRLCVSDRKFIGDLVNKKITKRKFAA